MTAYALNLLDLCFTLHALRHGGVELNPVMRCVPVMIAYKVVVVGALLWWLGKREERVARLGLGLCTAVFGGICAWHVVNLALIYTT